jgi:hypothetical protein
MKKLHTYEGKDGKCAVQVPDPLLGYAGSCPCGHTEAEHLYDDVIKLEDAREAVSVLEFKFQNYDGPYKEGDEKRPNSVYLTCKNHPTMLYSSKNPYQRSLHFLGEFELTPEMKMIGLHECSCDFGDLLVIIEDWEECK